MNDRDRPVLLETRQRKIILYATKVESGTKIDAKPINYCRFQKYSSLRRGGLKAYY